MSKPIEGKVAQILSERYIVIAVGARDGVRAGMRFAALAQGTEVKDPTTGESLGRWEVPKGFLMATHVQERLTTCEPAGAPGTAAQAEDAGSQVLSAAMITASMRPETWGGGGALEVNRAQMTGLPRLGPISVGDTVREVVI